MRRWGLLLWWALSAAALSAQGGVSPKYKIAPIQIHQSSSLPPSGNRNDWLWDTLHHTLSVRRNGWERKAEGVASAGVCHRWVWAKSAKGLLIFEANGGISFAQPHRLECWDSIAIVELGRPYPSTGGDSTVEKTVVLHRNGTLLAAMQNVGRKESRTSLQGMRCLHVNVTYLDYAQVPTVWIPQWDLRNWGILGENGRILIPTIYDHRLKFIEGVADAVTYGKHVKINEKGECTE